MAEIPRNNLVTAIPVRISSMWGVLGRSGKSLLNMQRDRLRRGHGGGCSEFRIVPLSCRCVVIAVLFVLSLCRGTLQYIKCFKILLGTLEEWRSEDIEKYFRSGFTNSGYDLWYRKNSLLMNWPQISRLDQNSQKPSFPSTMGKCCCQEQSLSCSLMCKLSGLKLFCLWFAIGYLNWACLANTENSLEK